jgi:cell division protein FtsI (penicillin-binding protein 3)
VEPLSSDRAASRLNLLLWIALVWAVLILGRLLQLQIVSHDELRRRADAQQLRDLEVRAPRGAISDRNGRPLAMSLPVDSVAVDPRQIKDPAVAAGILSGVLDLDESALLERLRSAAAGPTRRGFLWIKRKISREESERLRSLRLDWVEFRQESQRYYPKGSLAAHILGGVDHEERGNAGVEMSLEDELQGLPGSVRMLTDVRQRGYNSEVFVKPQPGRNFTLTLHEGIQYVAERGLKAAVEDNQCQTGSIVVMDPRNGDVLALANYPTYDPNEPVKPGDQAKQARFNLAASVPFEPGSVFKVITVAAALETTPLTPASIIPCGNGRINLFGRLIRDHDAYASLSMADVLAKSSNIGAIQLGLRVGDARMYEYVKRFGFGKSTGVPVPAESGGMVRRVREWEPSSIGSVAMGHELSATTLQLARACSVIANGGLLVRPRLLLFHQKPGRKAEAEPTEESKRILKPETAIKVRRMMEGVVLHGTGKKAHLDGYTAGGKTGSAQIFDLEKKVYTHRYNASFMGFAPVGNPRVVVVVTLNGASKYGGAVAAPVFREVASTALRLLDVPKDLPEGISPDSAGPDNLDDLAIAGLSSPPPAPPAAVPAAAGGALPTISPAGTAHVQAVGPTVPDFKGKTMRAVLEESAALGLSVDVQGSGLARAQAPPAGTLLAIGERVRVQFAR